MPDDLDDINAMIGRRATYAIHVLYDDTYVSEVGTFNGKPFYKTHWRRSEALTFGLRTAARAELRRLGLVEEHETTRDDPLRASITTLSVYWP